MKKIFYLLSLIILFNIILSSIAFAQLDNTFSLDGKILISTTEQLDAYQIKGQSDGKLVMVGSSGANIMVVRFNTDGTLDNTFDIDGILYIDLPSYSESAYALAIQADNKIIVTCDYFTSPNLYTAVIRLNIDGSYDTSFDSDGYTVITILSSPERVEVLPSGKIVIVAGSGIIRLNSDGSLDTSFDTDGFFSISFLNFDGINDSYIQSNGKFLLASSFNNNSVIVRLNDDGSFDNTFGVSGIKTIDVETDPVDRADAITVLENGNILVGGYLTNQIYLMRLNSSDGSIDNTYGGGDGIISYLFQGATNNLCYDIQEDTVTNDILVAGTALYGAKGYFALTRVSSTGSIEAYAAVSMSDGTSEARNIFIQPDRNIVLAGYAIQSSKYTIAVARFEADFTSLIESVEDSKTVSIGINLFPNPASQNINIHSTYTIEQIIVLDVLGNEVLKQSANGNTQMDISTLPKGLYNFVITTDKGIGSKKVSVQ